MPLTLSTRRVGRVTVVRCSGRMVAGVEADSVRQQISKLLPTEKHLVFHLGDVTFMDSSGLGTMVRMLATARQAGGDIKLCQVTREVATVLKITNLTQLFQMHEQEEEAIAAFYRQNDGPEQASRTGARLLCVDQSADVLAYVREFLGHAGFDVLSSSSVPDALILLRVTRPALLVLGSNLRAAEGTRQAFDQECSRLPVVELGQDFSTLHAGEAAADLLQKIQARLGPATR
ncbi:MAG: anti-sigma factor antagonist [Acidobacteriia bacterium]|nr:anti-sigma factor antagonist [Terriglobia bacterium]